MYLLSVAIAAKLKKSGVSAFRRLSASPEPQTHYVLHSKINGFTCRACSLMIAGAVMHGYIHMDSPIVDQTVSKIMKAY